MDRKVEALAKLLGSRQAARSLLERTTAKHLVAAPLQELEQLVPKAKAKRLRAAFDFTLSACEPEAAPALTDGYAAFSHVYRYFVGAETERLVVACVDNRLRPIHTEIVAVGAANTVSLRSADLWTPAVRHRALGILVAHNHPSLDPKPSAGDIELTLSLIKTSQILHVALIDHLVVAGERFHSIRDDLLERGVQWPTPADFNGR
jgi:DNA repair protein RadC